MNIAALTIDQVKHGLRHGSFSALGRPTEFRTTPGSNLILVVFKKQ